jgi:hypothetical protein
MQSRITDRYSAYKMRCTTEPSLFSLLGAVLVWARLTCGFASVDSTRWNLVTTSVVRINEPSNGIGRILSTNNVDRPSECILSPSVNTLRLHQYRGGASISKTKIQATGTPIQTGSKCPVTGAASILASLWGTGGVLYILTKAIKRVLPIALEPFAAGAIPLTSLQLG